MKVLLAVDGSPYTQKMLAYLANQAELLAGSHDFTVLNVQAALPPRARSALGKETVDAYYEEEAQKVLAPALEFLSRNGVQAQGRKEVGVPGEVVAQCAEEGKFDLLVMGSHGHGSLAKLVLGSVTTQVIANCGVPLLLVR